MYAEVPTVTASCYKCRSVHIAIKQLKLIARECDFCSCTSEFIGNVISISIGLRLVKYWETRTNSRKDWEFMQGYLSLWVRGRLKELKSITGTVFCLYTPNFIRNVISALACIWSNIKREIGTSPHRNRKCTQKYHSDGVMLQVQKCAQMN